ncbi:hypothetical protein SAICODRAFT_221798 [Saitoella complicata NRRL Y-17804]|uniref:Uncharacterized protein n=1 Tax=Saitoella complicata (strain BCRC 22490 / CBS 7301 / JCM 7358 / NBRC 10748 / NRRL Y-17804) TaxID=698492 RepID=A0A0E9NH84_SAICN|nr:uncharacterized protein SAICODRAFT_221798 [Saitoella complicata NRRL Y-17804]ODQ53591.1 hypothetical protein SAICODRAFT_221798 [Saitoella complicata NRRL Y-17804]GAO48770.1 hypothetical protein G7K_2939-t1 [Saitoella complicata NRRL Y-17804]
MPPSSVETLLDFLNDHSPSPFTSSDIAWAFDHPDTARILSALTADFLLNRENVLGKDELALYERLATSGNAQVSKSGEHEMKGELRTEDEFEVLARDLRTRASVLTRHTTVLTQHNSNLSDTIISALSARTETAKSQNDALKTRTEELTGSTTTLLADLEQVRAESRKLLSELHQSSQKSWSEHLSSHEPTLQDLFKTDAALLSLCSENCATSDEVVSKKDVEELVEAMDGAQSEAVKARVDVAFLSAYLNPSTHGKYANDEVTPDMLESDLRDLLDSISALTLDHSLRTIHTPLLPLLSQVTTARLTNHGRDVEEAMNALECLVGRMAAVDGARRDVDARDEVIAEVCRLGAAELAKAVPTPSPPSVTNTRAENGRKKVPKDIRSKLTSTQRETLSHLTQQTTSTLSLSSRTLRSLRNALYASSATSSKPKYVDGEVWREVETVRRGVDGVREGMGEVLRQVGGEEGRRRKDVGRVIRRWG